MADAFGVCGGFIGNHKMFHNFSYILWIHIFVASEHPVEKICQNNGGVTTPKRRPHDQTGLKSRKTDKKLQREKSASGSGVEFK